MDYKNFSLHRQPIKVAKPSPSINLPFSRSYGSTTTMKDISSSPSVLMVLCDSFTTPTITTGSYVDLKHNILGVSGVLPARANFRKSKSLPPVSQRFDVPLIAHHSKSFDQTDYGNNKHKKKYFSQIDEKLPINYSRPLDKNHLLKELDKPLPNTELILGSVQELDDQIGSCIDNTMVADEEKDLPTKPNSRFLGKNRKKKEKAKMKKAEEMDDNSISRCENKLESIKRMLAKKNLTDTENESTNVNYMKNFVAPNHRNAAQCGSLTAVNNSESNCEIVKAVISKCNSVNNLSSCTDDSVDKLPSKSEITMETQTLAPNHVLQTNFKNVVNVSAHKSDQPCDSMLPSEAHLSGEIQAKNSEQPKVEDVKPVNNNAEVPEVTDLKVNKVSALKSTMETNCVQKDADANDNAIVKSDNDIPTASDPLTVSPITETLSKCEMGINHIKELLNRTKCRRKTNKRFADAAIVKPPIEIKLCEPISSNSQSISVTMCEPSNSKAEIESGSESSGCGFSDDEHVIFSNSCSEDTSADENEFELFQRQISECDSEDSFICFVPEDASDLPPQIHIEYETSDEENDEETLIKCDEDGVESDSDYCSCERESDDAVPSLKGCLKRSGFRECSPRTHTSEKPTKTVYFQFLMNISSYLTTDCDVFTLSDGANILRFFQGRLHCFP